MGLPSGGSLQAGPGSGMRYIWGSVGLEACGSISLWPDGRVKQGSRGMWQQMICIQVATGTGELLLPMAMTIGV